MYNFHPPLSSLPFALLGVIGFLELANLLRRSDTLRAAITVNVVLAALGTVLAFFSGYQASELADQTFKIPDDAISLHHACGRALLFAVLPCAAVRIISERATHALGLFRALYYISLAISLSLVVYTGYLGGKLVFEHGAGVSAAIEHANPAGPLLSNP